MDIPTNKKVVCITGNVWSGSRAAPRRMLVKEGFVRPIWFTTDRKISDASYIHISTSAFHLANANNKVLAHIKYGGSWIGILQKAFALAMEHAEKGVLVVGPQEMAAHLASRIPGTIVFTLKGSSMDLSPQLKEVFDSGQLHRIDVDVLEPGAWKEANSKILDTLGLQTDA